MAGARASRMRPPWEPDRRVWASGPSAASGGKDDVPRSPAPPAQRQPLGRRPRPHARSHKADHMAAKVRHDHTSHNSSHAPRQPR